MKDQTEFIPESNRVIESDSDTEYSLCPWGFQRWSMGIPLTLTLGSSWCWFCQTYSEISEIIKNHLDRSDRLQVFIAWLITDLARFCCHIPMTQDEYKGKKAQTTVTACYCRSTLTFIRETKRPRRGVWSTDREKHRCPILLSNCRSWQIWNALSKRWDQQLRTETWVHADQEKTISYNTFITYGPYDHASVIYIYYIILYYIILYYIILYYIILYYIILYYIILYYIILYYIILYYIILYYIILYYIILLVVTSIINYYYHHYYLYIQAHMTMVCSIVSVFGAPKCEHRYVQWRIKDIAPPPRKHWSSSFRSSWAALSIRSMDSWQSCRPSAQITCIGPALWPWMSWLKSCQKSGRRQWMTWD